ncbi:MAG: hypothetical protein EAZ46_09095 [Runella sp.]|nr:MAG: hypothetical protein EAZ46_09095 [Runella sp.]
MLGVLDDPAIPVILAGTAIYAAVQNNIVDKMAREIDRILTKPAGPQGSVYELRVRKEIWRNNDWEKKVW